MTTPPNDQQMDLMSGVSAFESKHFSRAMKLLSPIANSGNPDAQYRLAIMYQNGLGVVRNELLAYKWMKNAAQQEFGPALHGLGFMYMEGDCVGRDDVRAIKWFEAAVAQGLQGAMGWTPQCKRPYETQTRRIFPRFLRLSQNTNRVI